MRIKNACSSYRYRLPHCHGSTCPNWRCPRKNEIGLVIGATETPSIGKTTGGTIDLNSSLALGAEYDRQLFGKRTTLYVGADFLASLADVKISYPSSSSAVNPEYAYLAVSPHIKVKFNSTQTLQPWLSFGSGNADFSAASQGSEM